MPQEVGIIIRATTEAEPIYADVQSKIGFLQRSLIKEQPKRVYTAMHYGTNDMIRTNIDDNRPTANDFLAPGAKYKAYIFSISTEAIIESIDFTTEAVPALGSSKWIDNTVTGDPIKFTLSIPSDTKIHTKLEETLLLPFYTKISYARSGGGGMFGSVQPAQAAICGIEINSCVTSKIGYSVTEAALFTGNTMHTFLIYGIRAISANEVGVYTVDLTRGSKVSERVPNLIFSTD